jgi:cold shock CspA family protein
VYGVVKWFDIYKRFGFLETEDPEFAAGIYVSEKHVNLPQNETLKAGDHVEFTVGTDKYDRPRAENVRRVDKVRGARPGAGRYLRSDMTAAPAGRGDRFAAAEALFSSPRSER